MIPITAIFGAAKGLPWKYILGGLLIVGTLWGIISYIIGAEENKAELRIIEAERAALIEANASMVFEHKQAIGVLTDNFNQYKQREKRYESEIQYIKSLKDTQCGRASPAIFNALRLRFERQNRINAE